MSDKIEVEIKEYKKWRGKHDRIVNGIKYWGMGAELLTDEEMFNQFKQIKKVNEHER